MTQALSVMGIVVVAVGAIFNFCLHHIDEGTSCDNGVVTHASLSARQIWHMCLQNILLTTKLFYQVN